MATLSRYSRVVVTGLGALAANGVGKLDFWRSLLERRSGIDRITLFDPSEHPIQIAGEVKSFDVTSFFGDGVKPKRLARQTQLALAAAQMAIQDAGLERSGMRQKGAVPVVIGVSSSAIEVIEQGKERLLSHGPARVGSHVVSACQPHAVSSAIGQWLGADTVLTTISTACPAGLDAVAMAADAIRGRRAEIAIAGGADAPINPLTVACFGAAGMVPKGMGEPAQASRPFDRDRRGGILAEGAAVVVLESMEHALARGAQPLLEIMGYGTASDNGHGEPASGLFEAMTRAMANSCVLPEDIDYICAHGPSDPVIDRVETEMIKKALGERAFAIPVSSIKGVTGNPLAAAGVLQVVTCAMAMCHNQIPPTANYENADPACDLDYVPRARRGKVNRAMINLHGLGGGNSALVVQRVT